MGQEIIKCKCGNDKFRIILTEATEHCDEFHDFFCIGCGAEYE